MKNFGNYFKPINICLKYFMISAKTLPTVPNIKKQTHIQKKQKQKKILHIFIISLCLISFTSLKKVIFILACV